MKFWIDVSTPKECLFFNPIINELKKRGHEIILTTREFTETNDLLKYLKMDARVIGKHGNTVSSKLYEGINRLKELYDYFKDEVIDGVITLVNPEVSRIAFGLGFPLFNFIDIIEATIVCKLTLPLSTAVFVPFHLPINKLREYWLGDKLYIYNALDIVAWMPDKPQPLFKVVGLQKHPIIVYRSAETEASYFSGYYDVTVPVVDALKKAFPKGTFFEIPRYKQHKIVDVQSLLYYADLFIGGGGTITEEACYWGTWSISCRPFLSSYDKWLIKTGNLYHARTVGDAVEKSVEMLQENEKNPAAKKIQEQIFPLSSICDKIEEYGGQNE